MSVLDCGERGCIRWHVHWGENLGSYSWGEPEEKQGNLQGWLKKSQISSYCRHIFTFPAHLNFISRSTSSMVLDPSSGASSLKKQGNLHRWLKNVRYCRHIRTFSAHWNFVSRSTSSMVLELSSGASSPKKQGNLRRWLKNVRYQAIADIF